MKNLIIKIVIILSLFSNCAKKSDNLDIVEDPEVIACPENYVLIPENTELSSEEFCVAKYEMRQDSSNKPSSQPSLQPWTGNNADISLRINKLNSISLCQSLGVGYDLISNQQWQAIARNIESVAANWTSGTVGVGDLIAGHTDGNPNQRCDSLIENVETDCSTSDTSSTQKRTHMLTTNEKVWDIGGNCYEWVKDDTLGISYSNVSDQTYVSQLISVNDQNINNSPLGDLNLAFGPKNNYSTSLNSGTYGSLGRVFLRYSNQLIRGGVYTYPAGPGVFLATNFFSQNAYGPELGFRCVYKE